MNTEMWPPAVAGPGWYERCVRGPFTVPNRLPARPASRPTCCLHGPIARARTVFVGNSRRFVFKRPKNVRYCTPIESGAVGFRNSKPSFATPASANRLSTRKVNHICGHFSAWTASAHNVRTGVNLGLKIAAFSRWPKRRSHFKQT